MKKIIKNPLFTFIFGIVLCGTVVVIADNLNASEIDYKETNVESALDTLYQRSTYTEYSGSTEITPSTTSQTLSTNNKLLKSNITINAIPNTFKELAQATTVEANKLLSGVTAYNNLGELIIGNNSITDCSSTTYTKAANSQINYSFGFTPSKFYIYYFNPNGNYNSLIIYNTSIDNKIYTARIEESTLSTGSTFTLSNNRLTSNYSTSQATYKSNINYYIVACK